MGATARIVAVLASLAMVGASAESWAHKGGQGGSGAKKSGARHHHSRGHGSFLYGAPFLYPWAYPSFLRPPYYYGPDFLPQNAPPAVYVEKFSEAPTPQTLDEIYCPEKGAHYPGVQECPGGWQRVIRMTVAPAQGDGAVKQEKLPDKQ